MNIFTLAMLKLFFAIECLAGFFLMLFGAGMIEHPDTSVALMGGLLSFTGVCVFVCFGVLLARRED